MKKSPKKLFACICKYDAEVRPKLVALFERGEPLPPDLTAIREKHVFHQHAVAKMGVIWASGPAVDFSVALQIYSLDSLEEAKRLVHEDEYYKAGVWHSDEWFEWNLHMPLDKVAPEVKEAMRRADKDIPGMSGSY
jgi:uncharacterized protein YciI